MTESHLEKRQPAIVTASASNTSPFGVCGCGGNVQEWCAEIFADEGTVQGKRVVPPSFAQNRHLAMNAKRLVRGFETNASKRFIMDGFVSGCC
jgi:formylglycine-generating enzyme required for sulfatase activity